MRGLDPDGWQYVGNHSFRTEPPDVFSIRYSGDVLRAEAEEMTDAYEQFYKEGRRIYLLLDLTRIGAIPAESRKLAAARAARRKNEHAVFFGASFTMRLVTRLVTKAIALARGEPDFSVFVATEAEARAWIEAQRRGDARAGA